MRKLPTVSVVIPTRDRSTDLSDLLSSILNQDYLPVETIVVDDSLLNTTEQVVASFVSKFETLQHHVPLGKSQGSNLKVHRHQALGKL